MKDLFARRQAKPGHAGEVKAWVTAQLELGEADLVTVAELACHEPHCPPIETVLTVHAADGARNTWHIHKPLSEVAQSDVIKALSAR